MRYLRHHNGQSIRSNPELDAFLNDIANIESPNNDDIIQRKSGSWVNRTVSQYKTDLASISLIDFASELTFDYDKEFETVLGGTTTFTLSALGHKNGVGIVARINEPVAVNFPAGFEAVNGSDSISTTSMNIIVFRYFENYDGAGNDKVLYIIKNQTAV